MKPTRRHEIEGAVLEVPLRYDQQTGQWIEEYPDLMERPVYTPAGERILLTIEDACPHGVLRPDGMGDCGSCIHYRQAPGTLLGVCGSPHLRIPIRKGGEGKTPTEEAETEEKNHAKEETTL